MSSQSYAPTTSGPSPTILVSTDTRLSGPPIPQFIHLNSPTPVNLTLMPAIGSGVMMRVKNTNGGIGYCLADPDDAETIDGTASVRLNPGDSLTIRDFAAGQWAIH